MGSDLHMWLSVRHCLSSTAAALASQLEQLARSLPSPDNLPAGSITADASDSCSDCSSSRQCTSQSTVTAFGEVLQFLQQHAASPSKPGRGLTGAKVLSSCSAFCKQQLQPLMLLKRHLAQLDSNLQRVSNVDDEACTSNVDDRRQEQSMLDDAEEQLPGSSYTLIQSSYAGAQIAAVTGAGSVMIKIMPDEAAEDAQHSQKVGSKVFTLSLWQLQARLQARRQMLKKWSQQMGKLFSIAEGTQLHALPAEQAERVAEQNMQLQQSVLQELLLLSFAAYTRPAAYSIVGRVQQAFQCFATVRQAVMNEPEAAAVGAALVAVYQLKVNQLLLPAMAGLDLPEATSMAMLDKVCSMMGSPDGIQIHQQGVRYGQQIVQLLCNPTAKAATAAVYASTPVATFELPPLLNALASAIAVALGMMLAAGVSAQQQLQELTTQCNIVWSRLQSLGFVQETSKAAVPWQVQLQQMRQAAAEQNKLKEVLVLQKLLGEYKARMADAIAWWHRSVAKQLNLLKAVFTTVQGAEALLWQCRRTYHFCQCASPIIAGSCCGRHSPLTGSQELSWLGRQMNSFSSFSILACAADIISQLAAVVDLTRISPHIVSVLQTLDEILEQHASASSEARPAGKVAQQLKQSEKNLQASWTTVAHRQNEVVDEHLRYIMSDACIPVCISLGLKLLGSLGFELAKTVVDECCTTTATDSGTTPVPATISNDIDDMTNPRERLLYLVALDLPPAAASAAAKSTIVSHHSSSMRAIWQLLLATSPGIARRLLQPRDMRISSLVSIKGQGGGEAVMQQQFARALQVSLIKSGSLAGLVRRLLLLEAFSVAAAGGTTGDPPAPSSLLAPELQPGKCLVAGIGVDAGCLSADKGRDTFLHVQFAPSDCDAGAGLAGQQEGYLGKCLAGAARIAIGCWVCAYHAAAAEEGGDYGNCRTRAAAAEAASELLGPALLERIRLPGWQQLLPADLCESAAAAEAYPTVWWASGSPRGNDVFDGDEHAAYASNDKLCGLLDQAAASAVPAMLSSKPIHQNMLHNANQTWHQGQAADEGGQCGQRLLQAAGPAAALGREQGGELQATIYDDQHMGDYVAVVANLSLSNSTENCKAVAGADPCIRIISVVEAAIITELQLPQGQPVVDLSSAALLPGLVLSLVKDGTLQLWHVLLKQCLWESRSDAVTAVLHPSGQYAITSNRSGELSKWTGPMGVLEASATEPQPPSAGQYDSGKAAIPVPAAEQNASTAQAAPLPNTLEVSKELLATLQDTSDGTVDCMRFLTSDLLALKTAGGRMSVHKLPDGRVVSSWRVPGCSRTAASTSSRCCFGHTADGRFVCVGNHNATAYVFDTTTGFQLTKVEACKVEGCVKACALSEDCRHLLMAVGAGFIFRFEYRPTAEELTEDGLGDVRSTQQQLLTGSAGTACAADESTTPLA
eukprot:gene7224-7437_t